MKTAPTALLIGIPTVILIFLYIKHQNQLIDLSYQTQKAERALVQLQEKKQLVEQELLQLKNHDAIKKRAVEELGMEPTKTTQIRYLAPAGGLAR